MIKHELVKPNDGLPFMLFCNRGVTRYIDIHWHRAIEIDYTLKGQADYIVAKKKYVIRDTELIIINSRDAHSVENIVNPEKRQSLVILVPYDKVISLYPDFINQEFALKYCPANILQKIKMLLADLYHTYQLTDKTIQNTLREGYVITLIGLLLQYAVKTKPKPLTTVDRRSTVSKIITYLSLNYHRKLSLQQIADEFCFSRSYLDRLFKRETGQSIMQYLKQIRVREAKGKLDTTNLTVSQIAERTGFSSPVSFRKAFCQFYGLTPQQYRQ